MPRTCSPGDVLGIPLPSGGYAVGLITRVSREHTGILLGFFFGPRRSQLPAVDEFLPGTPDDAVLVARFGGRLVRQGTWPTLGSLEGWEPHPWEVTRFVGRPSMGPPWIVTYDADDPSVSSAVTVISSDDIDPTMPSDTLVGWGQLPRMLDERLPLIR